MIPDFHLIPLCPQPLVKVPIKTTVKQSCNKGNECHLEKCFSCAQQLSRMVSETTFLWLLQGPLLQYFLINCFRSLQTQHIVQLWPSVDARTYIYECQIIHYSHEIFLLHSSYFFFLPFNATIWLAKKKFNSQRGERQAGKREDERKLRSAQT